LLCGRNQCFRGNIFQKNKYAGFPAGNPASSFYTFWPVNGTETPVSLQAQEPFVIWPLDKAAVKAPVRRMFPYASVQLPLQVLPERLLDVIERFPPSRSARNSSPFFSTARVSHLPLRQKLHLPVISVEMDCSGADAGTGAGGAKFAVCACGAGAGV
jgi:hypothetical protein